MSKRFGRNQRRKMRAQVVALTEQVAEARRMERHWLGQAADRIREYERVVERIQRFCTFSHLLPAPRRCLTPGAPPPKHAVFHSWPDYYNPAEGSIGLRRVDLETLLFTLELNPEVMQTSIHMTYWWPHEARLAYSISHMAFNSMTERDIVDSVAPLIAELLVRALREATGTTPASSPRHRAGPGPG